MPESQRDDFTDSLTPPERTIKGLPAWWRNGQNLYGTLATIRILGVLAGLLVIAPHAYDFGGLWALAPVFVLTGAFAHKITYIMHDCCHFNLFRRRSVNAVVGTIGSAVLGSSFRTFTEVHLAHHAALASARDPQAEDYIGFRQANRRAILWHLVKPAFGFSLYKMLLFNLGTLSPTKAAPDAAQGKPRKFPAHYIYTAIAQLLIAAVATDFGRIWWMIFFYPLAAATFGLMFSRIRSYCEHVAPRDAANDIYVRTHLPNLIDRLMIFELNFNFHREHHEFPNIASCHLPAVHEMKKAEIHDTHSVSGSIAATIMMALRTATLRPTPAGAE